MMIHINISIAWWKDTIYNSICKFDGGNKIRISIYVSLKIQLIMIYVIYIFWILVKMLMGEMQILRLINVSESTTGKESY